MQEMFPYCCDSLYFFVLPFYYQSISAIKMRFAGNFINAW